MRRTVYLAVSIHDTNRFVRASKDNVEAGNVGDVVNIDGTYFDIVRINHNGDAKLHLPALNGGGKANNGLNQVVNDPSRIVEIFTDLGAKGWTVYGLEEFCKRHDVQCSTENYPWYKNIFKKIINYFDR